MELRHWRKFDLSAIFQHTHSLLIGNVILRITYLKLAVPMIRNNVATASQGLLLIVRVAMYFRSTFVESCNQIHFWKAETSLKPKTNFPFERKTFWSAILDRKMDTSSSCFDNISHAKQYRNSIVVAMAMFLAVGKCLD